MKGSKTMHAFLDKYSVAMTALFLKDRWFNSSVETPGFQQQLEDIKVTLPAFEQEGFYETETHSTAGKLDPAFQVARWIGPEYPTIIYHHGNNETPFYYGLAGKNTFKSVLYADRDKIDANLISLRAAFHNDGMKKYMERMSRLENFTAMLSASVKLIEALTAHLKSSGCKRVIVTGISLGGWVANLHRSFYNSANVYIPIFAGAALEELFVSSYYKRLAGEAARKDPNAIRKALNFTREFGLVKDTNVFPLLARFDQFIEYDVQKQCYDEKTITVIDKGHITGALASTELRAHILASLADAQE